MNLKEILSKCDHTLLGQTATWAEIKGICDDGMKYKTASVCIPAAYVKQAKDYVGEQLAICTVIGFPNGYATTAAKVFMASDAIMNGADEVDMVINIGELKNGNYEYVTDEYRDEFLAFVQPDNIIILPVHFQHFKAPDIILGRFNIAAVRKIPAACL